MENVDETSLNHPFVSPVSLPCPAISIIIPMYNTEKYIGECLESILNQTFQSFEVIVVDDCSTDNSVEIVESYIPLFNGRLKLSKTEVNSGGGGYVPRNIGLTLAKGEYVWFIDADDFILLSALETLYNAAKEYNVDVVYTGSYHELKSLNNRSLHRDGEGKKLINEGLEDKPVLRVDDQKGNLNRLLLEEKEGNFRNPWSKFIRREFLIENKIHFPQKLTNGGDFIWVISVYCHASRFLRLPMPLYFYRSYNTASVTQTKREPAQQISHWVSTFVDFVKSLRVVENENEILCKNPDYCLSAFKSNFEWCLKRIRYAREKLSNQDIYEVLYREFVAGSSDSTVPFFFNFIDAERKISDSRLQIIKKMEKEFVNSKDLTAHPVVSVIIALYNAEKYVAECLDSLLAQTFQNFEVIVVDDCSTDNSVKIVESYAPKFNGKLTLAKMEKNSGGGALPRNKAVQIACGEYLQNLDADDKLTKTALEEMYTLAKDYDADVVYCEKYYCIEANGTNIQIRHFQKGALIKAPTLETKDLEERTNKVLKDFFSNHSCFKFIRRKLMVENEIFYPHISPSEDAVWTYGLIFYAKKFLRVPNIVYVCRLSENSVMRKERSPQQTINFWLSPVLFGLKSLDNLLRKHDFFKMKFFCHYALLKKFIDERFIKTLKAAKQLTEDAIYTTIKDKFGEKLGQFDVLISALCAALYNEKKAYNDEAQVILRVLPYLTARIDVKLITKVGSGDFQILSVSDEKANVTKPDWFNRNGIGYVIQSHVGKLEIIAKTTVDGKIQVDLRGKNVRNPEDKSKLVPYWIDYTSFTVNGQTISDKLPPVWHDKPYHHDIEVKAHEEIILQVEWFPHRSDTITVEASNNYQSPLLITEANESDNEQTTLFEKIISPQNYSTQNLYASLGHPAVSVIIPMYNAEKYIVECLDSLLVQTFKDFEVIVTDDCSTDNSVKIVENYAPKFEGRFWLCKTKKNSGGGGEPRNIGFSLASGEYVFFVDSDDVITETALEEMYSLAREFNADVVYCEKYFMSEGVGQDFIANIRPASERIQKPPFVDKPTIETINMVERVKKATNSGYWMTPWLRMVQRSLLIENHIRFDSLIGSNDIGWSFRVLFCSKRFLRVPNACYIRRIHDESTSFRKRTPGGYVHKWMDLPVRALKNIDNFISGIEFFRNNLRCRHDVLNYFLRTSLSNSMKECKGLPRAEVFNEFLQAFSEYLGRSDILVSAFYAYVYEIRYNGDYIRVTNKLAPYVTSRIDLKLITNDGDMQILSISDHTADVSQPPWFQKNGIGYVIQSHVGKLKIVAKATVDGSIQLDLRGKYVLNPEDKSKRIPYWIDYTNLALNGKKILDKITPAWHDESYMYSFNTKADEEIVVEVEWLPHRSDAVATAAPAPEQIAEIKKLNAEIESLSTKATKLQDDNAELVQTVENLSTKTTELQKDNTNLVQTIENLSEQTTELQRNNDNLAQIIHKFAPYFTARIDIKLISEDNAGDLQILSMSDDNADVSKPAWFNKNGTGYAITSYIGNLKITAKATTDGQIQLYLRSRDTRDPEDRSKRIPRWIDYTALTVNEQKILNELTPVWHDKPYRYNMEVKADEEITIEVDWLPHKSNT